MVDLNAEGCELRTYEVLRYQYHEDKSQEEHRQGQQGVEDDYQYAQGNRIRDAYQVKAESRHDAADEGHQGVYSEEDGVDLLELP